MEAMYFNTLFILVLKSVSVLCIETVQAQDAGYSNFTFVHLFEWKWNDIALECEEFLHYKGYGGVQISPPNEHLLNSENTWWDRYQPISYLLQSRSGNETEFKNMIKRCNRVGVRIVVDCVINHMAGINGKGTVNNTANIDSLQYPGVPYGPFDFHSTCVIDNYNDVSNVRNCRLGTLADLNQGTNYVRDKIIDYINRMIDYGIYGLRIDAAKHMWPADLKYIYENLRDLNTEHGFVPKTRPWIFQEVIDYGGEAVKATDYTPLAAVTEFKYSSSISRVFKGDDKLTYLRNWGSGWAFMDSKYAVVFVDNHDTQRNDGSLTYKDSKHYKMANAFMLSHPYGVPKVMSSFAFDQHDQGPPLSSDGTVTPPIIKMNNSISFSPGWICEHRWRQIYNMMLFRKVVQGTDITHWWSNGDQQISFCRGKKGFIAFNNHGVLFESLQTCLPEGQYCDIISGDLQNGTCTGKIVTVNRYGIAQIVIRPDEEDGVLAIHVKSKVTIYS